ncbi:MAG: hypothetical protein ACRDWF_00675 [Acidimicrobiia bacterium]
MARTDIPQDTLDWLLDSDPSIRWQVMSDLTDEPEDVVAAERGRVATEGWGARLLGLQGSDGRWAGGTYQPKWTSTTNTLALLRDLGLDPVSERASHALSQVREKVKWNDHPDAPWAENPYFVGEVEPCINARVIAIGSYFGQDVQGLIDRLLGEQLPDGGWNCEAEDGSSRSSFHTTINVLEAFLEHERATGTTDTTGARLRGEEYLLERRMFHRLSTGEVVDPAWTYFFFPTWWHYDVLRGLDYLRSAGVKSDERCADAIALVHERRGEDGRWAMHYSYPGEVHFDIDGGEGQPSRWITLCALRVLDWSSGHSTVK